MFSDRIEAGEKLAEALMKYKGKENCIVLTVPRGGVVPASIISKELDLPMDLILIKKIGHPSNHEYAIGAVSLKSHFVEPRIKVSEDYIEEEVQRVRDILNKRYKLWYGDKQPISLYNKTVILVDDGVATGHTLIAATKAIKEENPKEVIIAVPVGSPDTIEELKNYADEVICLEVHDPFYAVGSHYDVFKEVTDQEVLQWL